MVHLVHPNSGASQTVGELYAKTLERKVKKFEYELSEEVKPLKGDTQKS
jgi:hypothetical protein